MTNQQAMSSENYNAEFKRIKTELNLILLLDEVGLTKISKDQWSGSGAKEKLECLDSFKHETEKHYLRF